MSLQWTPWRGSSVCEGLRQRAHQRLWFAPPHLGDNLLPLLSQPWPTGSVNWATRGHWGMQSHFPVNLPKTDSCFYCPSSFLFNVSCIQECTFKVFPHLGEKTESYLSSPLLPAPHIQQLTHPIALTSAPPSPASLPQASPSYCQVLRTAAVLVNLVLVNLVAPTWPSTIWTCHRHCHHSQYEVIIVPLPRHCCPCWGFLPVFGAALGSQVHTAPTTQEPFPPISLQSSHLGHQSGWTTLCPASCLSAFLQAACSCFLPVDACHLCLLCSGCCLGEVVPELSVCWEPSSHISYVSSLLYTCCLVISHLLLFDQQSPQLGHP